jgi:hypothetical protein
MEGACGPSILCGGVRAPLPGTRSRAGAVYLSRLLYLCPYMLLQATSFGCIRAHTRA